MPLIFSFFCFYSLHYGVIWVVTLTSNTVELISQAKNLTAHIAALLSHTETVTAHIVAIAAHIAAEIAHTEAATAYTYSFEPTAQAFKKARSPFPSTCDCNFIRL